MKQVISQIHDLRLKIDSAIVCIEGGWVRRTSETTRALRSYEMAKGWFGKVFSFMELESPYRVAGAPGDIPPTADRSLSHESVEAVSGDPDAGDQLERVNQLRKATKEDLLLGADKVFKDYLRQSEKELPESDAEIRAAFSYCWKYLHEASMNLGFELQRLRQEHENTTKQEE